MYQYTFDAAFNSDLKDFKKNKALQNQIKEHILHIAANPTIGVGLSGAWNGFYKYKFYNAGTQYRIIFTHYPCCNAQNNAHNNANDAHNDTNTDDANDANATQICTYTKQNTPLDCNGLIDFCFVRTRQNTANLYAQNKKYTDNYKR